MDWQKITEYLRIHAEPVALDAPPDEVQIDRRASASIVIARYDAEAVAQHGGASLTITRNGVVQPPRRRPTHGPKWSALQWFCALANPRVSDEKIADFVRQWGPLDLDESGRKRRSTVKTSIARADGRHYFETRDPAKLYREYALLFTHTLDIARAVVEYGELSPDALEPLLHFLDTASAGPIDGRPGAPSIADIRRAFVRGAFLRHSAADIARQRNEARTLVSQTVNAWLAMGDVRPALEWSMARTIRGAPPPRALYRGDAWALLGLQLRSAVLALRAESYTCQACRRRFTRIRPLRPDAKDAAYCDDEECQRARARERQRRSRLLRASPRRR